MATMHVFVEESGRMTVVPAPHALGPDGPYFAGASPADESIELRGYEVEVDDELLDSLDRDGTTKLEQHLVALLRSPGELRTVQPFGSD